MALLDYPDFLHVPRSHAGVQVLDAPLRLPTDQGRMLAEVARHGPQGARWVRGEIRFSIGTKRFVVWRTGRLSRLDKSTRSWVEVSPSTLKPA